MIENMTFGSGAGCLPEGSYFGEFVAVDKVENKFQPGKGCRTELQSHLLPNKEGMDLGASKGDLPNFREFWRGSRAMVWQV